MSFVILGLAIASPCPKSGLTHVGASRPGQAAAFGDRHTFEAAAFTLREIQVIFFGHHRGTRYDSRSFCCRRLLMPKKAGALLLLVAITYFGLFPNALLDWIRCILASLFFQAIGFERCPINLDFRTLFLFPSSLKSVCS